MTRVQAKPQESLEELLKRFRRQVAAEEILSTVREKRFFVSKGEQRRKDQARGIRRARRRQRQQERRERY